MHKLCQHKEGEDVVNLYLSIYKYVIGELEKVLSPTHHTVIINNRSIEVVDEYVYLPQTQN
jgi:hypothetical protein